MIKSVLLSAVVAFSCLPVLAQKPAYPSKAQVLKDAQSGYALSRIKQIYNAPITWDKIKLENKTFVNGGERVENFFYDYESDVSKRLGLDVYDATNIYVLATTPKDKEGFYYEILITVTYNYYNATLPLDHWVLKGAEVKSNDYYQRGGSKTAETNRMNEVMGILKKFKGLEKPDAAIRFTANEREQKVICIDSIYKNPDKQDEALTYQRYWYYMAKCKVVEYEDGLAKVEAYYDATMEIEIEWSKPENSNAWSVKNVDFGYPRVIDATRKKASEKEQQSMERYKWLTGHGFDEVYKKKSTFTRSRYTLSDLKAFEQNLETALRKLYDDPEAGKTALAALVNPKAADKDAIVNSYYAQVTEGKKYQMLLNNVRIMLADYAGYDDGKIHFGSTGINIHLERKHAGDDKALMKKYKDAGVSKETLRTTSGDLTVYIQAESPEFVFENNQWYLNTPAKPLEQKFD